LRYQRSPANNPTTQIQVPGPVHHCQASIVDGIDSAAQIDPHHDEQATPHGGEPSRIRREIGSSVPRSSRAKREMAGSRPAQGSTGSSGKGGIDDDRRQLQKRRGDGRLAADGHPTPLLRQIG
jgi:hypothetical protein